MRPLSLLFALNKFSCFCLIETVSFAKEGIPLNYLRPVLHSHGNQSSDLDCKTNDWFLQQWNIELNLFLANVRILNPLKNT